MGYNWKQAAQTLERRQIALRMRAGGATLSEIGDALGVSKQAVSKMLRKVIRSVEAEEVQALRDEMIKELGLREFSVEEDIMLRKEQLAEGLEMDGEIDLSSLDNTVRKLINEGVQPSPTIDPAVLVKLYEEL